MNISNLLVPRAFLGFCEGMETLCFAFAEFSATFVALFCDIFRLANLSETASVIWSMAMALISAVRLKGKSLVSGGLLASMSPSSSRTLNFRFAPALKGCVTFSLGGICCKCCRLPGFEILSSARSVLSLRFLRVSRFVSDGIGTLSVLSVPHFCMGEFWSASFLAGSPSSHEATGGGPRSGESRALAECRISRSSSFLYSYKQSTILSGVSLTPVFVLDNTCLRRSAVTGHPLPP